MTSSDCSRRARQLSPEQPAQLYLEAMGSVTKSPRNTGGKACEKQISERRRAPAAFPA